MGDQWSYKPDDKYKSPRTLIHLLVDIVSKGGNFLLNVGPDADGQFPPAAVARLEEIGRWMRVNWRGDLRYAGGRALRQGRVRWTRKDGTIYLILLAGKDESGPPARVTVASVKRAQAVRLLGADQSLAWRIDDAGLTVDIPEGIRRAPPASAPGRWK